MKLDAFSLEEFLRLGQNYREHFNGTKGVDINGGVNDYRDIVDVNLLLDVFVNVDDLLDWDGHGVLAV